MKTIAYNSEGKVYKDSTQVEAGTSALVMSVEITEGKEVDYVDVTCTPNKAIFKNLPKSELEQLKDLVTNSVKALATKDYDHDKKIADLYGFLNLLTNSIKTIGTDVENLKKAGATNDK